MVDYVSLKKKAISLLVKKELSVNQLRILLSEYADAECLNQVIQTLCADNLLSDYRYTTQVFLKKSKQYGFLYIKNILKENKIDDAIIHQVMDEQAYDEKQSLSIVWEKKFKDKPQNIKEKEKQWRYLKNRGFSYALIMQFLEEKATCHLN